MISCTKSKQDYPCKASEMYQASALFKKAYSFATKNYDSVAILSAKYGLLLPNDVIEPYDLTLNNMKSHLRKEWAGKVFSQMKSRMNLNDFGKIVFHAGEKYRQYLIPLLKDAGIQYEVPLGHLGFGEQLRWYDRLG